MYWLTPKDISHLEVHNRLFIVNNYMEELIQKYYRVPNPDSDIHSPNLKFVTSAEILEHIAGNPVFRPSFSTRNVGDVMAHLGYSKTRRNNSHGWWRKRESPLLPTPASLRIKMNCDSPSTSL